MGAAAAAGGAGTADATGGADKADAAGGAGTADAGPVISVLSILLCAPGDPGPSSSGPTAVRPVGAARCRCGTLVAAAGAARCGAGSGASADGAPRPAIPAGVESAAVRAFRPALAVLAGRREFACGPGFSGLFETDAESPADSSTSAAAIPV
jgi:hypothetical protein